MGQVPAPELQALRGLPHVGDVRGRACSPGLKFVADLETRAPFPRSLGFAERFTAAALEEGLPGLAQCGQATAPTAIWRCWRRLSSSPRKIRELVARLAGAVERTRQNLRKGNRDGMTATASPEDHIHFGIGRPRRLPPAVRHAPGSGAGRRRPNAIPAHRGRRWSRVPTRWWTALPSTLLWCWAPSPAPPGAGDEAARARRRPSAAGSAALAGAGRHHAAAARLVRERSTSWRQHGARGRQGRLEAMGAGEKSPT